MFGAIIGDVVGSRFEFNNIKTKDFTLFTSHNYFTDDTVMTVACMASINKYGLDLDVNNVGKILKTWGRRYPDAGYGGRFYHYVFNENYEPYNSFGNGSAMRVSSAGWVSNDPNEIEKAVIGITNPTHNHPEGIKGAYVTAMCIYMARNGKSKEEIKQFVEQYYDLNFDYEELRKTYFHGEEICQNTVPQAIYCFLISNDFEDTIRTTISIGGDCDTTAAISGAIAEAFYGVPQKFVDEVKKYLTKEMLDEISIC
ncbi:MAG: ADP-ribosylglycohydrolase family protein, partial [Bacilli bacterium]|nr:ADP-ribosylglycohydrolase family protein [Bacilli bacterium]